MESDPRAPFVGTAEFTTGINMDAEQSALTLNVLDVDGLESTGK